MIYLIMPRGNNFGWGICGKYLVKELSELIEIRYITQDFSLNDIGDEIDYHFLRSRLIPETDLSAIRNGESGQVDFPVLQAVADQTLRPWGFKIKGRYKIGYTFFEDNYLEPGSVKNGREHYDILVAGSSWCEQVLRDHGLERTDTVIQGIDPGIFHASRSEKDFFKDRFVVFSGGKFELRKGQDLVIRAYKILQDRHRDVMLVNSWYNQWIESMKTMAASPYIRFQIASEHYVDAVNQILSSNGIDLDRVITLLPRPNLCMPKVYRNTDIGLFPNRCEGGTNLVLMEYMACGKPVIASYSSGHKDILTEENSIMIKEMKSMTITKNNRHAAVWDDPNLDEIVDHLDWAYYHRTDLAAIGRQSADDMEQRTWKNTAQQFYNITNSISVD